jgi:hypothetical protein
VGWAHRHALEQYDFVIYGTATAIVFNRIFFPGVDPAVGVIAGFATYAVGFLARPLGGCSSPATATGSGGSSCSSRPCS